VAQFEHVEHVAFEVDVAGDVRASDAELAGRSHHAPDRVGRPHDDGRRGIRRTTAAAVVGAEGDR
jgi:hypothetical protein